MAGPDNQLVLNWTLGLVLFLWVGFGFFCNINFKVCMQWSKTELSKFWTVGLEGTGLHGPHTLGSYAAWIADLQGPLCHACSLISWLSSDVPLSTTIHAVQTDLLFPAIWIPRPVKTHCQQNMQLLSSSVANLNFLPSVQHPPATCPPCSTSRSRGRKQKPEERSEAWTVWPLRN